MVERAHYLKVAQQLKKELDGKTFLSKPRMQITELLREASGEDTFWLKNIAANNLEIELLRQGIRVFPSLQDTTTCDIVRLFPTGTTLASLVDVFTHPGEDTDGPLADITERVRGAWD